MPISKNSNKSNDSFLFKEDGLIPVNEGGEGKFRVGKDGVQKIYVTGDKKVDFFCY